ncbi:MAG: hypothetical protein KY464_05790 [Gemmatimonadetes bacterium]|nr:hypothetical protein [Gemmatimonadota bacterium]
MPRRSMTPPVLEESHPRRRASPASARRSDQEDIAREVFLSRAAIARERAAALCESSRENRWLTGELRKIRESLIREIREDVL